jgi:hypothetical protein
VFIDDTLSMLKPCLRYKVAIHKFTTILSWNKWLYMEISARSAKSGSACLVRASIDNNFEYIFSNSLNFKQWQG